MAKVFDWNASTGSLKDTVSNTVLTNNGVVLKRTDKGKTGYFDGTSSKLLAPLSFNLNQDFSIIVEFNATDYTNQNWDGIVTLSGASSNYTDGCSLTLNRFLSLSVESDVTVINYTNPISDSLFHQIMFTYNASSGIGTIYLDNSINGSGSVAGTLRNITHVTLGLQSVGVGFIHGHIGKASIYDKFLTTQERNKLYKEFLETQNYEMPISGYTYPKPTSLSEDGLVAAYNMIPVNGELPDLSGNGNTGTITNCPTTKNGMRSLGHGIISKVDIPLIYNNSTIWTVSFAIDGYTSSGNFDFFIGSTSSKNILLRNSGSEFVSFRDSTGGYNDWTNSPASELENERNIFTFSSDGTDIRLWINGIDKWTVTPNDTKLTVNKLFEGYVNENFTPDVELQHVEFYDIAKDAKYAKAYHNQFANQIYLKEDFRFALADGTNQVPLGWNKGTGSFKIVETDDGKTLECVNAGTVATQSKQAYGTWEFEFYKDSRSNVGPIYYNILDKSTVSNHNGYVFFANNLNSLLLRRVTSGSFSTLLQTANDYVSEKVTYKIKITRYVNGEFTVYIKGGSFGDSYILVDLTGGTGSNPVTDNTHTSSEYSLFDVDSGDQISNIVLRKGIQQ